MGRCARDYDKKKREGAKSVPDSFFERAALEAIEEPQNIEEKDMRRDSC